MALNTLRCNRLMPLHFKGLSRHSLLSEVLADEKERDREERDKLGPLRPLTLSKSAPVMAAVIHDAVERSAVEATSAVTQANVHKSASATPLTLLTHSPTVKTEGLCSELRFVLATIFSCIFLGVFRCIFGLV